MDPSQSFAIPLSPFEVFELLTEILSLLPRTYINRRPYPANDSNLMCAGVCMRFLKVSRLSAFWSVELKTEEEARRFLAALVSNEVFVERNPGWPRINSTRSLILGNVSGKSFLNSFVR
jgi:hypothetical protein